MTLSKALFATRGYILPHPPNGPSFFVFELFPLGRRQGLHGESMYRLELLRQDAVHEAMAFEQRLTVELWRYDYAVELGAAAIGNVHHVL